MSRKDWKRGEMKLTFWHILVILFAIWLLFFYLPQTQFAVGPQLPGTTPTATVTGGETYQGKLDLFVKDKYAGGGVASATIDIYRDDGGTLTKVEQATSGSDGSVTTGAGSYKSGDTLWFKVSKSGYVTAWIKYVVPTVSAGFLQGGNNLAVELPIVNQNNWVIQVRDSQGNSYTDGGNLNKTSGGTPGISTPTLFIDIIQQNDNEGWVDSYDPIEEQNWNLILEVKISNTGYENVVVSSVSDTSEARYMGRVERGSAVYHLWKLDEYAVTRHVSGNTILNEGTVTVSMALDLSGYSGDTADIAINIYMYADADKFASYGTYGPDKTSAATQFDINLVD